MSSSAEKRLRSGRSVCGESLVGALRKSYGAKELSDRADSYVSRFIYRPISFYLTIPFAWMGCSANQVTVLRTALALVSVVCVATKWRSLVLLGSVLYVLCVLLDYIDGNLARLHGTAGELGGLLEELADQVGPSLFPFAIGVGLYFRPDRLLGLFSSVDPVWMLIVGAVTSIAYCLGAMAVLYIRVIPAQATSQGSTARRPPFSGGPSNRSHALPKAAHFGRLCVTEGTYLATVFGIVLAATFDVMSIYLLARGIRNVAALVLWVRRLIAHLSALRGGA